MKKYTTQFVSTIVERKILKTQSGREAIGFRTATGHHCTFPFYRILPIDFLNDIGMSEGETQDAIVERLQGLKVPLLFEWSLSETSDRTVFGDVRLIGIASPKDGRS